MAGGKHHEAHNAFTVNLFPVLFDGDLTGELAGGFDELRRRPGVDPELVADSEFAADDVGF